MVAAVKLVCYSGRRDTDLGGSIRRYVSLPIDQFVNSWDIFCMVCCSAQLGSYDGDVRI